MKQFKLVMEVLAFVIMGLACLAYLSIKLGKLELTGMKYYTVSAKFDSASGLKPNDRVEIAGVEVGKVGHIVLNPRSDTNAIVYMKIKREIRITDDAIASIRTSGIIGDKYVSLSSGASDHYLSKNGKIEETESSVDVLEMLSKYINSKVK